MRFPNISFFFKIDSFYYKYKLAFLCHYYFKLHNVLFTNLYIRIYRNKLIRLDKKNKRRSLQNKYNKSNRGLFLDKTKNQKKTFFKRRMNFSNANAIENKTVVRRNMNFSNANAIENKATVKRNVNFSNTNAIEKKTIRTYMTTNYFFDFYSSLDESNKKDWSFPKDRKHWFNKKGWSKKKGWSNRKGGSFSRSKLKKKKKFVFIDKFKDCGNRYNFDPFYPGTTYKLNEFNFHRTKRFTLKKINRQVTPLSVFDRRLGNIRFKYFNKYVFSVILDVYKNQKKFLNKKNNFLFVFKNNTFVFYSFLLFLKKQIIRAKFTLTEIKKKLRIYINKLNLINQFFNTDKETILLYLSYFKNKKIPFFSLYHKLVNTYTLKKKKYDSFFFSYSKCVNLYNSLLSSFKKKHNYLKKLKQKKIKMRNHFKTINKYERIHRHLFGHFAKVMRSFKINKIRNYKRKYARKNIKNNIYIHVDKYITLYRSMFKYKYLNTHFVNRAIIYIKATTTNVFLYFIYNNKLLFKKSCGELLDVKKKERRFWRNVYPLVETLLPFLVKMKAKYRFPFVSLYLNGSGSLCTPLISRIRKHNKKFRRLVYFLFNELEFFEEKTIQLKLKFLKSYKMFPIYRLKLYSILDGFNRLSKIYFAVNKVKDITSWPYNGCKRKKKKNVR